MSSCMVKKHIVALKELTVRPIAQVDFSEPLFLFAAHPSEPILVSALATGHVYCHKYDSNLLEDALVERSKDKELKTPWLKFSDRSDTDGIVTAWKTRRHKLSCRNVIFDVRQNHVGEFVYTAGTDHVIKKAATETGKVVGKYDFSSHLQEGALSAMALSTEANLLVAGTDDGDVLVFDPNNLGKKVKYTLSSVHEDAVSRILAMPAVSPYHFLTLGSTTMARVDVRKGVISTSEDQGDELVSMCFATDHVTKNNDKVLVAMGDGLLTAWRHSHNELSDMMGRIKISKDASIDAVIPTMSEANEDLRNSVWCGGSDGWVYRVNHVLGRIMEKREHSYNGGKVGALDEIGCLDIDYDYRLMSAGMESLKIWSNRLADASNPNEELADESEDSNDSESDTNDSDSDTNDSDSDTNSSDDSDENESDGPEMNDSDTDDGKGMSKENQAESSDSDDSSVSAKPEPKKPILQKKKRAVPTQKPTAKPKKARRERVVTKNITETFEVAHFDGL